MTWGLTAVAGASLVGGYLSSQSASDAASNAADKSAQASAASIAEQRRQFDINQANQAPYLAAGSGAVNRLATGVNSLTGEFGAVTPFNFQYDQNADPGTAFRMSEGVKALDRSAASRGGLLSGATLKGVQRYGQDLGSQEYQNAFNRYTTGFNANTGERNALFNRLSGVAGTGQTAANQVGVQGANMAGNVGNAYMTDAANQGNAGMAGAAMRNSAFSGAGNALGRLYGNYGQSQNAVGQQLSNQYGYGNVYGAGGGGQTPTATNWDV
jgi:hypothetical protein